MRLPDFFSKITKDKIPFIIGGVFVGALSLWVLGKVLAPWVRPAIKDACLTFLELKQDRSGVGERVVDVEAVRVTTGTMSKRIVTVGKLRANEEVTLRSEMAGRILEINFKEGEAVNKDDLLIQFENADLVAEVSLAEAELAMRRADHERITKLRSQNIESVKKFDETKAGLAVAEAKLEKARAQLAKSTIIAPFSGNIGLIDVSVGAYVQAAQDLVKLVDNTPIKIDFKVPEQNVHDVGVGQTAELRIDGFPDETIMASVASVDSSLDAVSHSLSLRATTPNDQGRLRAGMFAHISLIVGEKGNSIVVPESAVTRDGEREFVWIIKTGKTGRRRVITGTRENGQVEIVQGLRPDELVVTAGQIKLGEGTSVNVTNLESLEEALKEEGEAGASAPKPAEAILAPHPVDAVAPIKSAADTTPAAPAVTAEAAVVAPTPSVETPLVTEAVTSTEPTAAQALLPAESSDSPISPEAPPVETSPVTEETATPNEPTAAQALSPAESSDSPISPEDLPTEAPTPTGDSAVPPPPPSENKNVVSKMFDKVKNLFSRNKE